MSSSDFEPDENTPLVREYSSLSNVQIQQTNDNENTTTPTTSPHLSCFDYRRPFVRVVSLFLICFFLFGTYFCYVQTGALQLEFERDLQITTSQFTVFNSLYSWPNIFLCFFGGFLIDKLLGHRLGAMLFSLFVFLGQLALAFGAFKKNLILMYLATFLFGIGGETLGVAQKTYAVNWFGDGHLNIVFGFIASISLLGCCINQAVIGEVYTFVSEYKSGAECLGVTILFGSMIAFGSMICSLLMIPLDRKRERTISREKTQQRSLRETSTTESTSSSSSKLVDFKDILSFPAQLWLMVAIVFIFYSVTFPCISLAKLFFIKKYDSSRTLASLQQSLFFLCTVITSPIFGKIVDLVGFNLYCVLASFVMVLCGHLVFMFTYVNSFVPVVVMGLSLSLIYASLWPMVSMVVPTHQLATAYGLMQSFQNLGLAITNILVGLILENYGYFALELFFVIASVVGLVAAFLLIFVDNLKSSHLNLSKAQKAELISRSYL